MKISLFHTASTALLLLTQCAAFTTPPHFGLSSTVARVPTTKTSSSSRGMAAELVADPEGGDEMLQLVPMPNSRAKNMGPNTNGVKNEDGEVFDFWFTSVVDGSLTTKLRTKIVKEASKNAQFPGFRKGQIPPYAQPQMTQFAVQEGLIKTTETLVAAYGLKHLPGSAGELDVKEDLKDLCKGYKVGDDIAFTGTFSAVFDPEKERPEEVEDDTVVDVESVVDAVIEEETA